MYLLEIETTITGGMQVQLFKENFYRVNNKEREKMLRI